MTDLTTLKRLWVEHKAAEIAWDAAPRANPALQRKADSALDAPQAQATAMGWVRSMGPMIPWVEALLAGEHDTEQQRGNAA